MKPIVLVFVLVFVRCAFAQQPAGPVLDDFETMPVGQPPAAPWVCHLPEGDASIRITDAKSASGRNSLAISCNVPMEDRHKILLPRMERPIQDTGLTGTVVFEGHLLLAPSTDTRIVIALCGGPKGQKVVSLLNSLSRLHSAGRLVWNPVLPDHLYHYKFTIHKAAATADLEVSENGAAWRNEFRDLPLGKPEEIFPLRYITIYFGGPAKKGACAYFDDLKLETMER